MTSVQEICRAARQAAPLMRTLNTSDKNRFLSDLAERIQAASTSLQAANREDVRTAQSQGVSPTLIDRLTITDTRLRGMSTALEAIASAPDPVGAKIGGAVRPNGLLIEQVREPLGVIAVIYEARPTVTVEVAGLALKSGNVAILRGSSLAKCSNGALMMVIEQALAESGVMPRRAVQLVRDLSSEATLELLHAERDVDLLVPRGGPRLLKLVRDEARVPTVLDGDGNCHIYVDESADLAMAAAIVVNAKTSRPSVCNALETLLVHRDIAETLLPPLLGELRGLGVEIRGDASTCELYPRASPATEADWATEYLDLVLAVRLVEDASAAVEHINRWGTRNADGIVANDVGVVRSFIRDVDTGSVFVNASTRFSDGGEFGYGVELGVSTQKLHVRGPMGLESLTCVKNVVWGEGHTRELL